MDTYIDNMADRKLSNDFEFRELKRKVKKLREKGSLAPGEY
jgi:hypothetical protein